MEAKALGMQTVGGYYTNRVKSPALFQVSLIQSPVTQARLELMLILSQSPKFWDYRCAPFCPACNIKTGVGLGESGLWLSDRTLV